MAAGTVTEFDDDVGLGVVRAEDGRELPFHCTQIADGTRTIQIGAEVSFEIAPGHLGRWQAVGLTPRG